MAGWDVAAEVPRTASREWLRSPIHVAVAAAEPLRFGRLSTSDWRWNYESACGYVGGGLIVADLAMDRLRGSASAPAGHGWNGRAGGVSVGSDGSQPHGRTPAALEMRLLASPAIHGCQKSADYIDSARPGFGMPGGRAFNARIEP